MDRLKRDETTASADPLLAGLRLYDTDAGSAARVRRRCVTALDSRRERRRAPQSGVSAGILGRLEVAGALGLSAVYLATALRVALALYRIS